MSILESRSKIVVVAAAILFLCLALAGCAQLGLQPSPELSTQVAALVIVPTVVDTEAKKVEVFGYFKPETSIDIVISGTWQFVSGDSKIEMIEPVVLYVKTDAQGVFKGDFLIDRFRKGYDLSPGVYALKAVVDQRVIAVAPFTVVKKTK